MSWCGIVTDRGSVPWGDPRGKIARFHCAAASHPRVARVFSISGAESSGTKLFAQIVAHAAGTAKWGTWHGKAGIRDTTAAVPTEVHHLSLPWGGVCVRSKLSPTIGIFPGALGSARPRRFFVNITQHVRAHAARGAHAVAVIVVRDATISSRSKTTYHGEGSHHIASPHCHSLGDAARENEHARTLMAEALDQLELLNLLASPRASNAGRASRLLVSYESLMTLGDAYLRDLFSSLGLLGSWDGFVPPLHDGNAAFIRGAVNVGGRNALADESNEPRPPFAAISTI